MFHRRSTNQLGAIAAIAVERELAKGEVLQRRGQPEGKIWIVLEGIVGMPSTTQHATVLVHSAPSVIGTGTLVAPFRVLADAVASTDCRLLEIHAARLIALLESDAEIGRRVYQALATDTMKRFAQTITDAQGEIADDYLGT